MQSFQLEPSNNLDSHLDEHGPQQAVWLGLGALISSLMNCGANKSKRAATRDFFQKAFSNTADLHRSLKSRCFVPSLGFGCAPWSVRCRCSAGQSDARPLSAIGHTRNGRLVGRCDSGQAGLGLRGLREHKSGCPDQGRAKLKKVRLRRTLPKNLTGNRNVPGAPDGLYNPERYNSSHGKSTTTMTTILSRLYSIQLLQNTTSAAPLS